MDRCPFCKTEFEEIKQTGFVGCQHCYQEIDELKNLVAKLYAGKKYCGKRGDRGSF